MSHIWPMDVRTIVSAYAQYLRSFCLSSQRAVSYIRSYALPSAMISTEVLPPSSIQLEVNLMEKKLQEDSSWQVILVAIFLKLVTSSSHWMSGLGTSTFVYLKSNQSSTASAGMNVFQLSEDATSCSCLTKNECSIDGNIYLNHSTVGYGIYNMSTLMNNRIRIKGFKVDCLPLDGFFSSTLECYYNRTCLQLFASDSTPFTLLVSTGETRFSPSTSILDLISNSLVEKWSVKLSYAHYFTACAPTTCSYSFNQRNNFLVIFTTIIALIGGLNTVLRIVVPLIVRFIFKLRDKIRERKSRSQILPDPSPPEDATQGKRSVSCIAFINRFKETLSWLWTKIKTINLFDSKSNDVLKERREQQTTRLYIVFLLTTFIVLVFYNVLTEETKIHTVQNPVYSAYEKLYLKYPNSIQCSCRQIAIKHSVFMSISSSFHPICSSEFIRPEFFKSLAEIKENLFLYKGDFMQWSAEYFQWLETLCTLATFVL